MKWMILPPFQGGTNMFGLRQGTHNAIAPGKRPLSSMAPTMVTRDGKLVMVLGSPDGSRIISVVLQVLINTIDYQMGLAQAVGAPRIHEQYLPDVLFTEPDALNPGTVQSLQRMGYSLHTIGPFGAAEVIEQIDGRWFGVNDPRSPDGSASGG
jgi:gamma-glutamyltranspeptidase/glutathione hydrolase